MFVSLGVYLETDAVIRMILILTFTLCGGCSAASIENYRVPNTELHTDTTYFVVFDPNDERATHEVLREELVNRGINAASGFDDQIPNETKVIVRYGAQWHWDVTWYLLELDVRMYDADSLLLASGKSRRYSIAREPAEVVVRETLDSIFSDE